MESITHNGSEEVGEDVLERVSINGEMKLKMSGVDTAMQSDEVQPGKKESSDEGGMSSPVTMDDVDLADNPAGDLEEPEAGDDVDDEEDEDDLVIYDASAEQLELSGVLSELGRRGTQESSVDSSELTGGTGIRGQIEKLLSSTVGDEQVQLSEEEGSILGDSDKEDELAALQAEVEKEVSDVSRRALMQRLSKEPSVEDNLSTREFWGKTDHATGVADPVHPEKQGSSVAMLSPVTLDNSGFREAQQGIFADVPLMVDNHGGVFEGLLFCDTVDSFGRPIVVVNTSAIPKKSLRNQAFEYISKSLESVISKGPYILIFLAFESHRLAKVPAAWIVAAYRKLTRPFKKNVEYVIVVRPNRVLRGVMKLMSFVVKKKSRNKIKKVDRLIDVGLVTNGEVQVEHLSSKVLSSMGSDEGEAE